MPTTSPQNSWSANGVYGSGILVVHNSKKNATMDNASTPPGEFFKGLLIADDISRLHMDLIGAIVSLSTSPAGNVIGNGNSTLRYSGQAINNATSALVNGTSMHVIAWWE